ncbi:cell division initiation protein [Caloranaerobacter azorensis DSM 13643]|uniref:Cell division initiation protein n=1 Tax=Caloranaerobacter azorensis DSM 13643 TaxID=1121264 RepID=A0A1M5V2M9_9FIRM|nr:DivIVA domain-containing protein [Caloranaerobacter azorensis]SHH69358.1 cell division initiation protein [Caloranaerobacter azorensis DSM 13643]
MLTPLDIQNKEFSKSIMGYKETEVVSFLDEVAADYEKLYKENLELKDKVSVLNEKVEYYQNIEKTLQNTLVVAQNTAEEVSHNAKKEAELIIREAEENARKIIEDAHNEVVKIQKKYEEIRKELLIFKTRFKTFLSSQLETVDMFLNEVEEKQ